MSSKDGLVGMGGQGGDEDINNDNSDDSHDEDDEDRKPAAKGGAVEPPKKKRRRRRVISTLQDSKWQAMYGRLINYKERFGNVCCFCLLLCACVWIAGKGRQGKPLRDDMRWSTIAPVLTFIHSFAKPGSCTE